ncbi:MAG: hypothetical protein WCK86_15740 [Planctomycetia bacterium]
MKQTLNSGEKTAGRWASVGHLMAGCFLLLVALVGCGERVVDPELWISSVAVWKIPASEQFVPAPRGLYSDENDTVYVLDDAGRVLVFDRTGKLQTQWKMPESRIGNPEGIWKLRDERIAVADTHYHRIVIFHPDGRVDRMFGTEGRGPGQFVFPVAVAQDAEGNLYVGEYGDHQRIQKFDVTGRYLLEFGRHGTGEGEFQRPSGLALRNGEVFVVDAFNDRIQVFSQDGRFLRLVHLPDKSDPLAYPYDLRVLEDGRIYVIENKAARLTVLRPDGTILGRYGRPGRNLTEFYQPWDLTVLSDGRILIADTGNHRLVELNP